MSLRWPLKGTRGFSATPRRSWGSKGITVPQTPKPSRSFAKRVVKAAGPMGSEFFANSSNTNGATGPSEPTTYTFPGVSAGMLSHSIFTPTEYNINDLSRERVFVKALDVDVNLAGFPSASIASPLISRFAFMLVRGQADELNDFEAERPIPYGPTINLIAFQDIDRGVRILKRKFVYHVRPAADATASTEELNQTGVACIGRSWKRFRISARRFTLREPEVVKLMVWSQVTTMAGDDVSLYPAVFGHHITLCRWARIK